MGNHAGYQWSIHQQDGEWAWALRRRDEDLPLVSGAAQCRSHAAACVVRALIQGSTILQRQPLLTA